MTDDYQKDRERRDREYLEELILALLFSVEKPTCYAEDNQPYHSGANK